MTMKKRTGTCTEEIFWECVEEMGWGSGRDYDAIKRECLLAWTQEFGASFDSVFGAKKSEVYRAAADIEDYIGDDSRSDLSSHIVGLGKEVFEYEKSDIAALTARLNNSDYRESFAYAVPDPGSPNITWDRYAEMHGYPRTQEEFDDWKSTRRNTDGMTLESVTERFMGQMEEYKLGDWSNVDPRKYARWSRDYLDDILEFSNALLEENSRHNKEEEALGFSHTVASYFRLLAEHKTEEALEVSEQALSAWWGLVFIAEELGVFREMHKNLLPMYGYGKNFYGGENLINEHRIYMGGLKGFPCRHHRKLAEEAHRSAGAAE